VATGVPTVYLSLEMTAAQLRRRFIARFTSAESTGAMDPKWLWQG